MFERSIFGKVKNINLLVQDILTSKPHYKALYNCQFTDHEQLAAVDWPRNIQGLSKPTKNDPNRIRKVKVFEDEREKRESKVEEEREKREILAKDIQLSCIKLEEKYRPSSSNEDGLKMDRTETIKLLDIDPLSKGEI